MGGPRISKGGRRIMKSIASQVIRLASEIGTEMMTSLFAEISPPSAFVHFIMSSSATKSLGNEVKSLADHILTFVLESCDASLRLRLGGHRQRTYYACAAFLLA